MGEFDLDRTTAEDRLMKAVRRARLALVKAERMAKKLTTIKFDSVGNTYVGGKMPSFERAAAIHAEQVACLLQAIEHALDRKLDPPLKKGEELADD